MKTRNLFIGAVLAIAATVALAAGTTANLSWNHPTTYTDSTPLLVADIKETLIQWRRPGSPTVVGSMRVAAPARVAVATVVCRDYTFTATTIMRAGDVASDESTPPIAYTTGVDCKPNPPSGVTAN